MYILILQYLLEVYRFKLYFKSIGLILSLRVRRIMYTSIVFLPFLGASLSGLFGRSLGVKGVYIINNICLLVTTFLSFIAFYEVILCNSPVSIELFSWINSEHLKVSWSFYFDELTVSMLIPVLIVSLLVHIYSIGYMGEDPHQQRFFSYISLFTGLMLILVTGNNFLVMFVGWEGVGVCSYLLVHFWYTRIAAVKSGMNAMFTNRIGDYFLTIGFFVIFFTFGTLDYATVFSLAPYINNNVITFIIMLLLIGAAAKSAQLGLHIWLPFAMEGKFKYWLFTIYLYESLLFYYKSSAAFLYNNKTKKCKKDDLYFNNKPISNDNRLMDAIIGDLLGDGHIQIWSLKKGVSGRMGFTFSVKNLPYLEYLKNNIYKEICTNAKPTPWPNPKTGKIITQYWFGTKSIPLFVKLHKEWYERVNDKYIKKIPLNIDKLLKPRGLAHWIMGDGYWSNNTVIICTDCYTYQEIELLINALINNFDIKSVIKKRIRDNGILCWRIQIEKFDIEKLRNIVIPFMIPDMLYKLNIK